ncbi:MAG: N-6 DNA methylase [Myxococcales bacterium]|nr:N-6 DNA methylase [Myxococcales bacterium]
MGIIINIFKLPELRKRVLFTLMMLAVYRLGVFIAVPGVDRKVMADIVNQGQGGFLGYFNMFSGGALEQLSVFALGIMPYISASIIIQLMTVVIPRLEQLSKEGETGRRKINQYSRYGTVGLAFVQGYVMANWLESQNATGQTLVLDPGLGFQLETVLTLTGGTVFLMWLGEQITERGIGNGISLVIFAGIIANLPLALYQLFQKQQDDPESFGPMTLTIILVMAVLVIAFIVVMERGQRRITVQYAKRVQGRRMFGGNQNYLRAQDVERIVATVAGFRGQDRLARVVGLEEIAANDYNLNISRYVDTSEPRERIDLRAAVEHLRGLERRRAAAQARMEALLDALGHGADES